MDKIEEHLNQLPDGYRELALGNYRQRGPFRAESDQVEDMEEALEAAFNWDETREGAEFWLDVTNHYVYTEHPLPPLPRWSVTEEPVEPLRGSPCYYRVLRLGGINSRIAPVEYKTLKGVRAEAERLAGRHPGDSFEVVKCIGVARCTKPTVFWNDGIDPDNA